MQRTLIAKMIRCYFYRTVLLVCLFGFSSHVFAWGIVHDPINYGELVITYKKLFAQYELLQHTYNNAKRQLATAQQLTRDSQGHYSFGGLINSAKDMQQREWSPNNWQSALQGLSGGNPLRYQALVNLYKKAHPTLSQTAFKKGASQAQAKVYLQDIQVNRAANVNATYAFNNIKTHLVNIHAISEKIDTAPNTKAAIDLNSRLLAEVAYIQAQELKMQILMNQQMAQVNSDDIAAKTTSAKFNTLPIT